MTTIALDENWDIFASDEECLSVVTGCEEIVQGIKQNIRSIDFVPLLKDGSFEAVSSIIKSTIINTSGVLTIDSYQETQTDVDCGNFRNFIINFTATTVCGNIQASI